MRFTRKNRVRTQTDYAFVKSNALKADCSAFVVYVKDVQSDSRLGIIATKRLGGAVERNYAKRIFREIFRKFLEGSSRHVAVVVFVRRAFIKFSLDELLDKFRSGVDKAQ